MSTLVQIVKNGKVGGVSLFRQGDTFAISAQESLNFLLKRHFPMHLPFWEEQQEMEDMGKCMNSVRANENLHYFQVWKVKAAIVSFQPMKASRPDDVKPVVLQRIGDEAVANIKNLLKRLMMSSFIQKR